MCRSPFSTPNGAKIAVYRPFRIIVGKFLRQNMRIISENFAYLLIEGQPLAGLFPRLPSILLEIKNNLKLTVMVNLNITAYVNNKVIHVEMITGNQHVYFL